MHENSTKFKVKESQNRSEDGNVKQSRKKEKRNSHISHIVYFSIYKFCLSLFMFHWKITKSADGVEVISFILSINFIFEFKMRFKK